MNISMLEIAKALGGSPRFIDDQRRVLMFVERMNDLAVELGGLKFAVQWLKTPMVELGGLSTLETLQGNQRQFDVGIHFIDAYLNAVPD